MEILKSLSIDQSKIIIPLNPSNKQNKQKRYCYFNKSLFSPVSSATVKDPFPYELAFAATIHKAQGRTINKVVVDLTKHPDGRLKLKFASVYVALSRIKHRADIRLIQHQGMTREQSYGYITQLKPHPDVVAFYNGFYGNERDGYKWNSRQTLEK